MSASEWRTSPARDSMCTGGFVLPMTLPSVRASSLIEISRPVATLITSPDAFGAFAASSTPSTMLAT